MKIELSEEEILILLNRVKRRISRLEVWLYNDKFPAEFEENGKFYKELTYLRNLKKTFISALQVKNETKRKE